jgi:hypothetical protein
VLNVSVKVNGVVINPVWVLAQDNNYLLPSLSMPVYMTAGQTGNMTIGSQGNIYRNSVNAIINPACCITLL